MSQRRARAVARADRGWPELGAGRHTERVLPVAPLPTAGEVFLDTRGSGRALRVTFHHLGPDEGDLVVLSLWNGGICTGTFRLPVQDVPDLVDVLRDGLARSYDRLGLASEI